MDHDDPVDLPPPPAPPSAAGAAAAAAAGAGDKKAAAGDAKSKPALPPTPAEKAAGAAAAADADKKYVGHCLCKKIKVTVVGQPQFSGFCHCTICSKHGGTDRGYVAGWAKDKVTIEGKEFMGSFNSSEKVVRSFCKTCGTGIANDSPAFTGVSPALFSDGDTYRVPKELAPTSHIFYNSSCLLGSIKDGSGLPLFKDAPKPMGGSGEVVKE